MKRSRFTEEQIVGILKAAKQRAKRLRDERLNETLFTSLAGAREVLADWRDDYNRARPHSSLANKTPIEFARQWGGSLELYGGSIHRPIAQPVPKGQTSMGSTSEWREKGAQVMGTRHQAPRPDAWPAAWLVDTETRCLREPKSLDTDWLRGDLNLRAKSLIFARTIKANSWPALVSR